MKKVKQREIMQINVYDEEDNKDQMIIHEKSSKCSDDQLTPSIKDSQKEISNINFNALSNWLEVKKNTKKKCIHDFNILSKIGNQRESQMYLVSHTKHLKYLALKVIKK